MSFLTQKLLPLLRTCRSNFDAALLRQLAKDEKPKFERMNQLLKERLQAAGCNGAAAHERRAAEYRRDTEDFGTRQSA